MAGFLTRPAPKHEVMRDDAAKPWEEPECAVCSQAFDKHDCQIGNFGKLHIVEEFQLDGSHVVHIIAPHYVFARLESMQVMATLDDATYADPFTEAVKILAHLGYFYQDGVLIDNE